MVTEITHVPPDGPRWRGAIHAQFIDLSAVVLHGVGFIQHIECHAEIVALPQFDHDQAPAIPRSDLPSGPGPRRSYANWR